MKLFRPEESLGRMVPKTIRGRLPVSSDVREITRSGEGESRFAAIWLVGKELPMSRD